MFVAVQWLCGDTPTHPPKWKEGIISHGHDPRTTRAKILSPFALQSSPNGAAIFFFFTFLLPSPSLLAEFTWYMCRHIVEDISSALCPCFRAIPVATVVAVLCKTCCSSHLSHFVLL